MDVKESLTTLGLSDKESTIYLTLLQLGQTTLQKISASCGLPRTTTYHNLAYLHEKGLVSVLDTNNITNYIAVEPEKLLAFLDEKRKVAQSVIPQLSAIQKTITQSSVQMFQGKKGITAIFADVFSSKKPICYFGSYSLSVEKLTFLPSHYRTTRLDNNIAARIILDAFKEEVKNTAKYKKLTQIRLNQDMKNYPCMIFIYEDKVAMFTLQNDFIGTITKNKEFAKAMQITFENLWSQGKKLL